jgi:hypothetical protein
VAEPKKAKPRKPRAPAKIKARANVERLTTAEYHRSNILLLEQALAKSEPGTIAYIQTVRAQMDARERLDAELAKGNRDPWEGLTEDEIREKLREEGAAMPDTHLEILVQVYCDRHGLAFPLRAVAGGAR